MSILYLISKIITLPGAYIKAFWEHLTCRILRIPVENTKYMHYDEAFGHIEHEFAEGKAKSFLLCWLPGLVNALFGFVMLFAGYIGIFYLGVGPVNIETGKTAWIFYIYLVMLYLGLALLCNLFPLVEDAVNMWDKIYGKDGMHIVWKIILFIPSIIIYAGAYIEKFGINIVISAGFVIFGIFM